MKLLLQSSYLDQLYRVLPKSYSAVTALNDKALKGALNVTFFPIEAFRKFLQKSTKEVKSERCSEQNLK